MRHKPAGRAAHTAESGTGYSQWSPAATAERGACRVLARHSSNSILMTFVNCIVFCAFCTRHAAPHCLCCTAPTQHFPLSSPRSCAP